MRLSSTELRRPTGRPLTIYDSTERVFCVLDCVMFWMDYLVVAGSRFERIYPRLFPEGWGEPQLLKSYLAPVRDPQPPVPLILGWHDLGRVSGFYVSESRAVSPAQHLPAASRTLTVRMISPVRRPQTICVMMAAFNDHGFQSRSKLAELLASRGIATAMLENPYYGTRRVNHHQQVIRTVLDLLIMGKAAATEGRSVLAGFRREGIERLGVSGYSMGGNIAALIGATLPFPVAVAPLAPSHSPGPVYSQGVLSRTVAWEALGGLHARERLGAVLGTASALDFTPPLYPSAAVLASARSDVYIPRQAVLDLHAHWSGSELRWLPGGHVSLWLFGREKLAQAIEDAFSRLPDG